MAGLAGKLNLLIEPEVKEYLDFLNSTDSAGQHIVTHERIDKNFENYGKAINTFLAYPDLLVDLMVPEESTFGLYFYQRILLRAMNRHRQVYVTATRAASKSFLAFLSRYITTMLLPGHKSFIVADVKKQGATIAKEKVLDDLWVKFPLLANEMVKRRRNGKLKESWILNKDEASFKFTHGGEFDVVGNGESVRGGRRHSGIVEEVINQDKIALNERIIPLMNVNRRNSRGKVIKNEPHAAKIYVTTAGYQGTFAYDKLIESLCYAVIDPDNYMVLGMSFKVPMLHGLIDEKTIRETIASPTFAKDSFDREYVSIWSGAPKGAAFNALQIRKQRILPRPEFKATLRSGQKGSFYAMGADMAKDGVARTTVVIYKIIPKETLYTYRIVNIFDINNSNYAVVSNILKRQILLYNIKLFVYDANGIGAALRDWINRESEDEKGNILPAFGIINPPKDSAKDTLKVHKDLTICYEVKATGDTNTRMLRLFFGRLNVGALSLLTAPSEARVRLMKNKWFRKASRSKQRIQILPHLFTDLLEEEMKNLDIVNTTDGQNIQTVKLIRRNLKIQKDFFSAASYGMWGVHEYLELPYYKKLKTIKHSISEFILYN